MIVSGKGSTDSGQQGFLAGAPHMSARTGVKTLAFGPYSAWRSDRRRDSGNLCQARQPGRRRPYRKSPRLFLPRRAVGGGERIAPRAGRIDGNAERGRANDVRRRRSAARHSSRTARGISAGCRCDRPVAGAVPRGLYVAQGAGIVAARNCAAAGIVGKHGGKACRSRHPAPDKYFRTWRKIRSARVLRPNPGYGAS